MPTGHHGACIPEGVRAMHFIMGTQRGIIWVETLRTFMLRRTATDTTWSGVDPVRSRQVLESIAWAPLAPPQCRRSARHTRTMLQSAWVADLFTAEEVDLIRATPALERLHNEADDDDHLLNALTRVLPLALNNIARLAAAVLQIDLDTASTSPDSMKRHIRGAVYEIHRVHDRLTALDVVQCDVAVMPVEIVDRYVVDHLVSAARTVGCIAAGATNMASIRTACDIANASVKGRATSPSRRVMWCNYAVLFARRFATLDLCSSRFDRALFMTRRLRNGFDWHDDCDRCPFCRVRTPFLVQHWCTRSSGGGCPNRKMQSLQHDLWASLESLLGASASLTLVQAAKRNAACWPKEEDIAWCKPRSLAMRLVLGGQLESQEIPGLG